jgi:crotonobetainyl-CoA:carnitine CoA-transferase CaiB-like acyl-CoA transferase
VNLYGSAVAWLPTLIASLFATGRAVPPGEPMLAGGLAQYDVYATADGRHVTLGALEPKFLANFLNAVGQPELIALAGEGHPPVEPADDRYADAAETQHAAAAQARDRLREALRGLFATRTLAEWTAALAGVETCFAPVNTLAEAVDDPQAQALGMFTSVEHPRLGSLPQLAPPFAFSATPAAIRRPPPDLGEHNAEILAELGPL